MYRDWGRNDVWAGSWKIKRSFPDREDWKGYLLRSCLFILKNGKNLDIQKWGESRIASTKIGKSEESMKWNSSHGWVEMHEFDPVCGGIKDNGENY